MTENKNLRIPLVALGAASAWVVAVIIAAWVTWGAGPTDPFRPWVGIAVAVATSWTVIAAMCIIRCQMVRAIVRQITLHDQANRLTQI